MSQTVISLKLGSLSSDTRLQDDIRISIPIDLSENETYAKDRSLVCVFWNDSLGLWSDDGCTTRVAVDNTSVNCHCNHLTSFGVLMKFTDYEVSENNEKWLKHIFYIGCGISLFCLITTFIIFVYLDNLKTERKKIHMNLIVALCLAQITHVVGIGLTSDAATCTTIAVLLHFLYTATFTWMLCEGIHLYHKVIAVFETEGASKRILYYVIGWGVPVIIVAISVGIRHDGYGRDDFCWLSITDVEGNHDGLIWAFIGPVCLVILINFGIMVAVMRVVVRSAVSVVPREKRNLQTVKAGVKSVLILTPILGVNWVLGLLAVNEKLAVFEFLFVIINSLQGLLIFIFHCVGSSEVRSALKRKRDQSSRSLEPSSDDKNRKKSRLKVSNWFSKNSDTKNWPPNIFHRPSSGSVSPEPVSRDIIECLVDGRLGRNVGGLRHMVESPPTPNLLHVSRGKVNGAYQREDSTLSNLSAKHVWQAPPQHTSYSGASTKFSISTVTTSLGDGSDSGSRRSSGSGEGSQHDFSNSSLCSDLHDQISQHKNSAQPSSIHKYQAHHSLNDQKNGMYDELGDINELQDIEDYET